jgi:hypothetical protein
MDQSLANLMTHFGLAGADCFNVERFRAVIDKIVP